MVLGVVVHPPLSFVIPLKSFVLDTPIGASTRDICDGIGTCVIHYGV